MDYCYLLGGISIITGLFYFWERKEKQEIETRNKKLMKEVKELKDLLKQKEDLLKQKEEEDEKLKQTIASLETLLRQKEEQQEEPNREEQLQEIKQLQEIGMFEDGKIYLTGEAIRRLGREWKLGLKGVRKRLELLGLVREGRTRKSINGTIQHAYIYTWTKNGQKMDNKWTKDGQPLEP